MSAIWILCVAAVLSVQGQNAGISPVNLTCDSWQKPLGIDDANPRLGWQVVATNLSERAQSQTAYQIQAASSTSLLASNQPDLWDSGKVSGQPLNVPYGGSALASVQQVFWQVRVWDINNQLSAYSSVATWTMGLLNATNWQGGWLWLPLSNSGLPIFRRQFTVNAGLQRALIYICGLGQYELSANGAKVGNALLAPGWSKYDKTCLYDTLDLTSYLTNGNNAVGVMLGNGMYNVSSTTRYSKFTGSFGPPRVIAQIHLYYTNGTSQVIASDTNWLATSGPITYSHVFGGENYDARLVQTGWNQAGFNASSWSAAVVTNGPGGILRGQSHAAPPIVATQTLLPVRTNVISSSTMVYDLGQNAAIIAGLTAHGEAGAVVQITPAELTNSDGTIDRSTVGGGSAYWQYTLAGAGSETWMPQFFYHGCRYLRVTLTAAPGSSQLPVVDALSGVVIQSATANTGDFSCSNDLFNRTRGIIRWAQRNNLISILTDCPHRERLGWLEQYNLHGPSLRYEFDVGQLFSKTMQDMADSQTSAGLMPSIAPEYPVFSGGFRDSPEWGSSVVIVPWQHYLFTGDDTLLYSYYSTMTNYFGYLRNQAVNNFLNYPNGLGDWYDIGPNPPGYSQCTPVSLTADAYYCQDAQILGQAAAQIGKTSDAAQFNLLATNIATAFNNTYYSAVNGYYSTGSQTAQSMPLSLGMVNPTNQASVIAALVANVYSKGLTAGDIGHRYLLRALADMGRSDVVFDLHSGTNGPGYGYILNTGATALTEGWDGSNSQDHFMLGHITEWFYHDLAGIQYDPALPGFQHVIIKPAFVGGITWVNASYNSVRGTIVSAWTFTNNQATLNVTIPVGSTGSVCLPTLGAITTNLLVRESGTVIWQNGAVSGSATGVTFDEVQGAGSQTCLVWTVGSGSYQFTWNVFAPPTGLGAVADNKQVALSWNVVPNVTGYNVKRSLISGGPYSVVGGGVTGTNYTDLAVTNGVAYYYVVSSLGTNIESVNSAEISAVAGCIANFSFETPGIGTYQYNPSGASWTFTAQSGANGSGIAANNSAFTSVNTNAPQGVQVAFLQGASSVSQVIGNLSVGANYTVTFAAAQRNYQQNGGQTWNVTIDGSVAGSFSPARSATNYVDYSVTFTATASTHTLAFAATDTRGGDNTVFIDNVRIGITVPPAPAGLTASAGNGFISLAWSPAVGATNYNIKRSCAGGGPYTTIGSATMTNYTDMAVTNRTGYYYVVSAVNSVGEGSNSASAFATPGVQNLTGTIIGTPGSWNNLGNTISNVFDGNLSTFFDGPDVTGDWVGLDFGAGVSNVIAQISYCPRAGFASRMNGGTFQGANSSNFSGATTLFTISAVPTQGVLTSQTITNTSAFRYVRYVGPANGSCNVAELQFLGWNPAVPAVSTTSPTLGWQLNGSQLQFVWPADHIGWCLQAQTNASSVGLSTNWVAVPGSTITNQFTFQIGLSNGSVFFRLTYP